MATNREKKKREIRYVDAKERAEKHDKKFEPTAWRLPEGKSAFRFTKAKTYRLDFMPYVAGTNNPNADEGFVHYENTYWIHNIPTPDGTRGYCCLNKTFGEKCYICSELAKATRSGTLDQDTIDKMSAKERQLFNVKDLDEPEKDFQIMEFNWWEFGRHVDAKVQAKAKYKSFYHLEGGRTLEVTTEEKSFMGKNRYVPKNFEFEEREDYDNDVLDQVACLDELPIKMTNEELKAIFEQAPMDSDKDDDDPKGKGKTVPKDDEDEDESENDDAPKHKFKKKDVVMYDGEECDVTALNKDGTYDLENEEGEEIENIKESKLKKVLTKEDEDDEDEKPAKKKPKPKDEDEDEDEDDSELEPDDDEDEKPVKKGNKKKPVDDDDEDEDSELEPEDESPLEEDSDDDEKPAKKRGRPSKK